MQKILFIYIKSLNFLLQRAIIYLEPKPKDVGFFFEKPNLLRPVSRASHYQLLITLSRLVASKRRTLSYWLAITMALTRADCLLVLDGLTSIVALMFTNCKTGGEVGACLIIDE